MFHEGTESGVKLNVLKLNHEHDMLLDVISIDGLGIGHYSVDIISGHRIWLWSKLFTLVKYVRNFRGMCP